MRRLAWQVVLLLLVGGSGRPLVAQEVGEQLADRAPRFLLASAVTAKPIAVDAASVPVLRQRISVDLDDATLEQALTAITRDAGLRLVYSKGVVPLDSRVKLEASNITVAGALIEVLMGAGVDVMLTGKGQAVLVKRAPAGPVQLAPGSIVGRVTDKKSGTALAGATVVIEGSSRSATTGSDGRYRIADVAPGAYALRARYIGYAPATGSVTVGEGQEATADFGLEKSAQRLDEVVTTGTVVPTEVKALPTPISVITGDELEQKGYQRVDQVFRGDIPGAIAWDLSSADWHSLVAVRGASTITADPSIKTFIDGVEVANPTYIATIDPNSVDRIEIIRGPQASTLYGAGALSGVMQIFTKKGQFGLTRPEMTGKLSIGGVGGYGGSSTALRTDNSASVTGGGENASYNVGASYRRLGEWVANYHSTDWGASAGAQTLQGPFTLSGSARYFDKSFDVSSDPRFPSYAILFLPSYLTYRIRQQTYGVTAGVRATRNWHHTLTLGYDQSYFSTNQTQPQFTTPADSFLSASAAHAAKTSLLYHTDLNLRLLTAVTAVVTAGVNYDAFDYIQDYTFGATRTTGSLDGSTSAYYAPWTSTGYFGQMQLDIAERLFLTGGLRAERNASFGADYGTAWSPRVGAAYALGLGRTAVKLRASYGESIRAPDPGQRGTIVNPFAIQLANPALAPERQRGVDGGVEVYVGHASLGVTYYNQRAIDLIQYVTLPTPPGTLPTRQNRNISRVKNEGWEFEGRLPVGPVQLTGTYSITNSTIQELPPDYPAGDYQAGDRVRAVPHTSAGATITYSPFAQTTLSASMTHIGHWIENDWIALYGFYFGGDPYRGSNRAYWIEYPTVTKFTIGVSQQVAKGVQAFLRAENVGNTLRYEQYNASMPMPRTVIVGANVRY
jgi:outer membrane receptor protein involved in Fe transport